MDIVGVSVKESRFCNEVSAPSAHPRSAFYFIGRISYEMKKRRPQGAAPWLFYFFPLFYKLLIQLKKRPADIIRRNDRL